MSEIKASDFNGVPAKIRAVYNKYGSSVSRPTLNDVAVGDIIYASTFNSWLASLRTLHAEISSGSWKPGEAVSIPADRVVGGFITMSTIDEAKTAADILFSYCNWRECNNTECNNRECNNAESNNRESNRTECNYNAESNGAESNQNQESNTQSECNSLERYL